MCTHLSMDLVINSVIGPCSSADYGKVNSYPSSTIYVGTTTAKLEVVTLCILLHRKYIPTSS